MNRGVGLVLLLSGPGVTVRPAFRPAQDLPQAMTRDLREEGLVGVVWATVNGDSVATGAAGLKDARRGEPLRADSRVHIGSVTKTLIAAGVLRLVTTGRLALDTPVAALLPDLAFDDPWADRQPLLLRHLLDHTSGLDDARLWQVFSLRAGPDTPLREAFTRDPSVLRLRSRPGSRFSYSNMGYALLGMVIESVTGERYEEWLDQALLPPLGMHASTFRFVSQSGAGHDPRLAMGHFEAGAPQAAVPQYLRPATQFTTTAGDMARFARFLMSDGTIGGARFIHADLLRGMGRPTTTEAAAAGLDAGYGLGLSRRDRHGVVGRCHAGNTVGYRAMLCLFPEERKAFFVSHNADSESADYGRFEALLIDALGVTPAPATPADAALAVDEWEGVYVPAPNRFATFRYLDYVLNFVIARREGAGLRLWRLQAPARELVPAGDGLLRATDRATASHALIVAEDGARIISDGFQSYRRIAPWRLGVLWAGMAAGLGGLAWLVVSGAVRLVRRALRPGDPIVVPLLAVVALILPAPFFLGQSFLALGDLTAASGLLALVTGALPVAMLLGLWRAVRRGPARPRAWLDIFAMLAVAQWCGVLAAWGLVPLTLWR